VREEDRGARAIALRDADPRVRRQAARAARDAKDTADAFALAEMARVDPEPIVRSEAVRAMARLPPDAALVNRLSDLWTAGDDELREDIAMAWASPGIFEAGGRDALRVVLASGKDASGVMEAAAAVSLVAPGDKALWDEASGAILRGIEEGSRRTRLHAIAVVRLPSDGETRAALDKAAKDADAEVKIAALSRLLELPDARAAAGASLLSIATESPATEDRAGVAAHARFALASAGDARVLPAVSADLRSPDPYTKLAAATALAALGRSAKAAPLLADSDPMVRTRAACTLLMAVRRHK
jgi:HEAT repeat protein